jgi:hypothetical protein
MTKKFNTRLNALKALLFWSIRLLAIHFLLLWIKFTDQLEKLKDHGAAIVSQFLVRIKSKIPSASVVATRAMLVWMKFTGMLRGLKTYLSSIFTRFLVRIKSKLPSANVVAIRALLVWMKFTGMLRALKTNLSSIFTRFLVRIKNKLPSANVVAIKALLVWMKFTGMLRGLKTHLSLLFSRLLARLKRISLRGFFKSLLSRYLLYMVLINAVPLLALAWIYFGTLIVPASVHSTHSSSWWIIFQWVVIVLSVVHGVFSIVLLRMRKITQGYIFSLLVTCSPFLYAYAGYARQVNGFSVSGTLNAFIPFLIAYSKIILGMIVLK